MIEKTNILNRICRMSEDDNQGLQMTTTVLNACKIDGQNRVTFQVSDEVRPSAALQSVGIAGDYICCAFFIKRSELEKYK